ncbi:hypothetical protein ACS0PU_007570 [Formica fusca]
MPIRDFKLYCGRDGGDLSRNKIWRCKSASERDNEFVTHYRTKLGTRRADTSYRRRPLMTRCVTDIHAAAVRSLRGSTVANKSEKTIRDY